MSTRTHRATGSAAIAETVAPGTAWQLESIRLHLGAAGGAGATNFTATINHSVASAYDFLLLSEDLTTVTDLVWSPNRPMEFLSTDELDIAYDNNNGETYGLEIVFKDI